MSPSRSSLLLLLLLPWLVGCPVSPPSSATGAMRLAVSLPGALPGEVSSVTVTASAPDMTPRSTELVAGEDIWNGVLEGLPAGAHRTFVAQGFDAAHTPLFEGRAEDVTVTADATGLVTLTLQRPSTPPPLTHEPPVIDSLVVLRTPVSPGGSLSLTASAHAPDADDTVSYAWSAASGHFSAPTGASTTWTAPTTVGPVTLTLRVSDSRGASVTQGVTVEVSADLGAGEVKVDFNTAPRISSLFTSLSSLGVGRSTGLSVSATDADADALGYQWSATCAGTFTDPDTARAAFTPSAVPTAACNNCQLSVVVTDGRGGRITGRLSLCIAAEANPHAAPTLTHALQSSLSSTPGQTLTFEVEASDPAGSALAFSWSAPSGTLGSGTSSATRDRIEWTAPACVPRSTPPSVTATVTNAFGLSVTRRFAVLGLPTCGTPSWSQKGPPVSARGACQQATLLPDGRVLISGGALNQRGPGAEVALAEVYAPASGTWSATSAMASARCDHTATLLPSGKVLVAGGHDGSGSGLATAELYDPASGTWSPAGAMSTPRDLPAATLLPSGKVLIVGGLNGFDYLKTAEVYDPATGLWSTTTPMASPHVTAPVTLLRNGKVLIAGGALGNVSPEREAEVYDPVTGSWSVTGGLGVARENHTATLLPDGRVLVSGGSLYSGIVRVSELYDPLSGTWSTTGGLTEARYFHTATLLTTGQVLVAGGQGVGAVVATAEVYDPATGLWSAAGTLSRARYLHTATRLDTGQVLVVAGAHPGGDPAPTELYTP